MSVWRLLRQVLLALGLVLMAASTSADEPPAQAGPGPLTPHEVPAPLRPWIPWVLYGVADAGCPWSEDDGARRCLWPGRAALDVTDTGGTFRLSVETFGPDWIPLPGGPGLWPEDVRLFGAPVVVVPRGGRPAVRVTDPGRWELDGRFAWPALPPALPLPPAYALVDLTVRGATVPAVLADDGRLWLADAPAAQPAGDRLALVVHRLLHDEQPFRVVTEIALEVAGAPREIRLTGALLEDAIPLSIDSPLPARLDGDGSLRVQLRPGSWRLTLVTRQPGPVDALELPPSAPPWPAEEVWAFAARPDLRVVELDGATVVDPRQTTLPEAWRGFPAYRLGPDDTLRFIVQRRGDPEPEPDTLALVRDLWLDFDGGSYTIRDRLSGEITRSWRLETGPALALGHVAIDGEPQFVTELDDGSAPGVEVRRGSLSLEAHARHLGSRAQLPAVGWRHDVSSLQATLHLPPGWRLWSARGVDNVPDTWLTRWTLLDLFLVLIAAAAIGRLWNRRTGLLAAVTLALIWQEPGAPRQVWLHLLAALALLQALPTGRLRAFVRVYRGGALIALAAIGVVFVADQVRVGFFPQLERPWQVVGERAASLVTADAARAEPAPVDRATFATVPELAKSRAGAALPHAQPVPAPPVERVPDAVVQTGPGLPDWTWTTVDLSWNGPVARDQMLELTLLPPLANLLLALLRVAALAWLALLFFRRT